MPDKPDVSELKKMRAAERKKAAMRQLKAAFERASTEGTLQKRSAKTVASSTFSVAHCGGFLCPQKISPDLPPGVISNLLLSPQGYLRCSPGFWSHA